MRTLLITLSIISYAYSARGQQQVIAILTNGCWQAGDGGMQGEYCFQQDGQLRISPTGRMPLMMRWEWDRNKDVLTWRGRGKPIKYTIDVLNDTSFVLYDLKQGIRLVGER